MTADWITTMTGRRISVTDPKPEDIVLEDIAAGLRQFRFGALSIELMTVAQHSIIVSQLLVGHLMLEGLFHDAHEAYVGDMKTPIKKHCPDFQRIEKRWDTAIRKRFNLAPWMAEAVHHADRQARLIEGRFIGIDDVETWGLPELQEHQTVEITSCMKPNVAQQNWTALAVKLLGDRG